MVVLESCVNASMLTGSSHQYLQPDQFPSLPASMDAKSSPLAMLQKTCSQIGADTSASTAGSTAAVARTVSDKKKDAMTAAHPAATSPVMGRLSSTSVDKHSTFRPYEMIEKKPDERHSSSSSGGSRPVSVDRHSPSVKTPTAERKTPKSVSPSAAHITSGKSISPAMRSGAELLSVPAGYPAVSSPSSLSAAALSASFLAANRHALLSPLLAPAVPPAVSSLYGYAAAPSAMPRCINPYCTCSHAVDAVCPVGCPHCQHARLVMVAAAGGGISPSQYITNSSSTSSSAAAAAVASLSSTSAPTLNSPASTSVASSTTAPLVCSWMAEGRYCGQRFGSTDQLMNHLRCHTGGAGAVVGAPPAPLPPTLTDPSPAALYLLHQQQQQQQLYQAQLLAAAAAAQRGVAPHPSPALFAAASRFHPYQTPSHVKLTSPLLSSPSPTSTPTSSSSPSSSSSTSSAAAAALLAAQHQSSLAAAAAAGFYSPYAAAAAASLYGRPLP